MPPHTQGPGIGSYLVGMKGAEPALNVGGVPAGDQAAALEGPQLQGRIRPSRDHFVEGILQGHWVIMGSLVLQVREEGQCVTWGHKTRGSLQQPRRGLKTLPGTSSPGFKSRICLSLHFDFGES